MLSSSSFSYLPLLVTIAVVSCCIKVPAAQNPPPSSSSCSCFSPHASWLSKKEAFSNIPLPTDEEYPRNLNLFKQTSFALTADGSLSTSFTFTISYSFTEDRQEAFLALILARSPLLATAPSSVQSMGVSFGSSPVSCLPVKIPFHVCNTNDLQVQTSLVSLDDGHDDHHDENLLKYELSFTYLANISELHGQVVYHGDPCKIKQAFNLSLLQIASSSTLSSNETTKFFIGYITNGESTSHVTPSIISAPPPPPQVLVVSSAPNSLPHKDDDKTKHIKVVAWVVVGAFVMGTLLGLIILVLFIKKRRGRRPVVSSLATLEHGSTPLERRAGPFTHHGLESSATPMMNGPPLPPIHSDAFQISGTASWLKQPNPR